MAGCPGCGKELVDGRCAACGTVQESISGAPGPAPYPTPSTAQYPVSKERPPMMVPVPPPMFRDSIIGLVGVCLGIVGIISGTAVPFLVWHSNLICTGMMSGIIFGIVSLACGVIAWNRYDRLGVPAIILGGLALLLSITVPFLLSRLFMGRV